MEIAFVLAQIFGVVAWLLMVASYYRKNTDKIIFVQILSIIFYCLNYLFLGAFTGIFVIIFELIRDYLYYKTDKDDYVFLGSIPFYLVLAYFSRGDLIELIPIIASVLEGFTLTRKKNIVVSGALVVYTMWIIYDLKVLSYTGAITDLIIVLSNLFIFGRYLMNIKRIDSFRVYGHRVIHKDFFDVILDYDKKVYPKKYLIEGSHKEKLYNKNKDTFCFIKYRSKLIGYINFLVIDYELYEKIINDDKFFIDYDTEDILKYKKNKKNYILINSIVVDEEYDSKKIVTLYNKTINKYLKRKQKEGYIIEDIIAVAVAPFEKSVLNNSILINKKEIKDNNILYRYKNN